MTDPLESLLVSNEEVNRELLAITLADRVRIDRDTGEIIPLPGWNTLRPRQRILAFLLAGRAAVALDVMSVASFLPRQVISGTGVPAGTVKRELREMIADRLVSQESSRAYYIPGFALERAAAIVRGDVDG